jgi:hypothetical protein
MRVNQAGPGGCCCPGFGFSGWWWIWLIVLFFLVIFIVNCVGFGPTGAVGRPGC